MLRTVLVLLLTLICAPVHAQVTPGTSPLSVAKGGTGVSNATNSAGDVLASNGANGSFVHTALNAVCTLAPNACTVMLGYANTAWFGAKCDGSTDDTAAIQTAGNTAISANGYLFIQGSSSNGCLVSKNGALTVDAALEWTAPISVIGVKGQSKLFPSPSMAATTTIIYFVGNPISFQSYVVDGLFIGNPSAGTRPGNHAIVFDSQTTNNVFIAPAVRNSFLQQTNSGGSSIFAINSEANNPNGGLTFGDFGPNNFIGSGISLNKSGDSIKIHDSTMSSTSSNPGVFVNLVNGTGGKAGNVEIRAMNSGVTAGHVVVDCAASVLVLGGEYEQTATSTETNNAIIDIRGSVCNVTGARVLGVQAQALGGVGSPVFVNVGNATGSVVDYNTFTTPTAYAPVNVAAAATGTKIGQNNSYSGTASPPVVDAGTGTIKPGQILGTAANDNASAGNVGEFLSSSVASGSAVALVTNSPSNITNITLTAGDWDVDAIIYFTGAAGTVGQYRGVSISTVTAAFQTTVGNYNIVPDYGAGPFGATTGNTSGEGVVVPPTRFSLASSQTTFLVAQAGFTVSTMSAYGIIRARRVR